MAAYMGEGTTIDVPLTGTVAKGDVLLVGDGLCVVALESGVSGDILCCQTEGVVHGVNKSSGAVWGHGDRLFRLAGAANEMTNLIGSNNQMGFAWEAGVNGETEGAVKLWPSQAKE